MFSSKKQNNDDIADECCCNDVLGEDLEEIFPIPRNGAKPNMQVIFGARNEIVKLIGNYYIAAMSRAMNEGCSEINLARAQEAGYIYSDIKRKLGLSNIDETNT